MTPQGFKSMRRQKGYSQSELARELDVHVLTISKWERGVVPVPKMAALALSALRRNHNKGGRK
jgi:DNA-binding transcriptional regulator YiaG